jgi:hypothetical protein
MRALPAAVPSLAHDGCTASPASSNQRAAVPPRPAPDLASGRRWVVALALRDVLPSVEVHRARPPEAGYTVRHEEVEPQVAHLQPRDLVDPQATQCDNRRQQQPRLARCGAGMPGCHASSQRTVETGYTVRHQVVELQVAHLQPRDLVDSQATQRDNHRQQQPRRARCGAGVPGRHASSQRTVAF